MKTTGNVTKKVATVRGPRGKKVVAEPASSAVSGRVPRVTKLMASAIKFDQMLRDGTVKDQAETARLGFVTRARVTQIMNLLNLAPNIQESLPTLDHVEAGKDELTERHIRRIVERLHWRNQQFERRVMSTSKAGGFAPHIPSGR